MSPYRTNAYDPGTVERPARWYQRRMPAWLGALVILCVASGVQAQTAALRLNGVAFGPSDTAVYVATKGAKGDNSNNDATAINLALTAACATGGAVYLPAGTYKINSTLTTSSGCANIDIVGAGSKTVINANAISGPAITLNNCSNCSVRNLKISGSEAEGVFVFQGSMNRLVDLDITGATLTGSVDTGGVMMQDAVDVWIERVYAHGNGGAGAIQGTDIGTYGGSTTNKNITIKDCKATSTAVAVNIGLWNTSHSLVSGCYANGAILNNGSTTAGGYGILFYKTGGAVEWGQNRVVGNHVESTQGSGIYMQNQPNSVVTGNRIKLPAISQLNTSLQVGGIAIGSANPGSSGTVNGVAVTGNTISGSAQAGVSAGGDNNTIEGNSIDGSTDAGIMLRDFHRGTVSGNVIQACGGGVVSYLTRAGGSGDVVDNVSITGNTIYAPGLFSAAAQAGIQLSGVSQVAISNNSINNPQGHGIAIDTASVNVTIVGNGIYNAGQSADNTFDGVKIADSTYVRVKDNQLIGSRHKFAVEATGTSDNLVVGLNQPALGHAVYSIVGSNSAPEASVAGFSTQAVTPGGTVYANATPTASVTSGETDAQVFTLPANTFSANGQRIHCHAQWVHAANANATTYKIYAFGTALTAQVLSTSSGFASINVELIRLSSTSVGYVSTYSSSAGAAPAFNQNTLTGLTLSGSNVIKTSVTGATTNGDLTANYMRCEWWP